MSEILYNGEQLNKKTEVSFTAPILLKKGDEVTFTITNGTDQFSETYRLGADIQQGKLFEYELTDTRDTTGYYVSGVRYVGWQCRTAMANG